ncbi:MAG TPA: hypothetical protein VLX58_00010 [Bryobacteraceae bacterium]|nr:hypothetical protein [Bryobacteraceae bacterium]
MSILYLIPVWFILALVITVSWSVSRAYRRSRRPQTVICPETNDLATIQLNARDAVAMHLMGNPARKIELCTRWPDRQGCAKECLAQLPHAV